MPELLTAYKGICVNVSLFLNPIQAEYFLEDWSPKPPPLVEQWCKGGSEEEKVIIQKGPKWQDRRIMEAFQGGEKHCKAGGAAGKGERSS